MERNVLKERLINKDDKNRHFVLLIIDISKHGAKEMGHIKMAGPGFVNDNTFRSIQCEQFKEKLSEIRDWGQADRHFAAHYRLFLN
jgi:hypothetical protein